MHTWHSLALSADEWIIAYACVPPLSTSPCLFSIGHAVELYLKAAHAKMFGDFDQATSFGHRIKVIWDACKRHDPRFMIDYQFKDHIFNQDFLNPIVFERFTTEDQLHLISHQNLYLVYKHLPNLKYFGLP